MVAHFAASDRVLCRAGTTTTAELIEASRKLARGDAAATAADLIERLAGGKSGVESRGQVLDS